MLTQPLPVDSRSKLTTVEFDPDASDGILFTAVDFDPFASDDRLSFTAVDFDPFADGELALTAPTTRSQQEIWLAVKMGDGANCAYNESQSLRLQGELDLLALQSALQQLVHRHEALRINFSPDGQTLCILAALNIEIPLTDLTALEPPAQTAVVAKILAQERQQPFAIEHDPLFRSQIVKLADREHLLVITAHHLICDGWSWGVLNADLGKLYSARQQGITLDLAAPARFSDYAILQAAELDRPAAIETEQYWLDQFSGEIPVVDFPTDHPRPPTRTFNVAREDWPLPPELVTQLRQLGSKFGCSFMTTMLAGLEVWLHRMTGQPDLVVGVPAAGQISSGQEDLVGHCVNLLPLRTQIDRSQSFAEYLHIRRSTILDAYEHQQFTVGSLMGKIALSRDASRVPLVPIVFNLDRGLVSEGDGFAGLEVEFRANPHAFGNFELFINATESLGQIELECQYNTDLFTAATIRQRLAEWEILLAGIVTDPDQPISRLPLLTVAAQQQLIDRNQTQTDYPRDRSIHQVFEQQVELTPDAIAIIVAQPQLTPTPAAAALPDRVAITYRQLNNRANQLAHHLKTLGVTADVCVGICVERSVETMVGILGILKAGGAYVPLDPDYPQERLSLIVNDTQLTVILTQQQLLDRLPPHQAQVVILDTDAGIWNEYSTENLPSTGSATDLAYVMYTSGSTGQPKGVSIIHRGAVRLVKSTDYASFTTADVFLHIAPISFDASTLEIWGALLNGGKLVIFPPHQLSLAELGRTIEQHQVTTLWLTAGLFQSIVDQKIQILAPLRQLLAGGDALSVTHVQKFLDTFPHCQLINGYGPTENTTFTACYPITRPLKPGASIPLGRPISNTQVYILDQHRQPVPDGVPGELYAGGDGLARGYFNRPELTAKKFVPHPFDLGLDARLYRTGDLARYLPDGNIEFLGRIDNQVKINGFRIELGEIETVLCQHPAISQTTVIVREDTPGDKRLVAYCVIDGDSAPTIDELSDFISHKVPNYMVPSMFVVLSVLPMTPNGKIDRRSLPSPAYIRHNPEDMFIAPRNELETELTKIWQKILGVPSIGIKDNFFELGGHSLLAFQLFAEIEKTWGKNLPLATLFQAETIEELANVLHQKTWVAPWSSLVTIQATGTKPPLFCIHPIGGNILEYYPLASYLGADQPIYGLQSQGLDGKQKPLQRVEEMASHYIKDIRTIQPHGPYQLLGYSFGGVIALEIAQQLHAQGQKVAFLGLVDLNSPNLEKVRPSFTKSIQIHLSNLWCLEAKDRLKYIRDRIDYRFKNYDYREFVIKSLSEIAPPSPQLLNLIDTNFQASRDYIAKPYAGDICLFRCQVQTLDYALSTDLGWGDLVTGKLEIYNIPSIHYEVLREPSLRIVVEKIKLCLEKSQSN